MAMPGLKYTSRQRHFEGKLTRYREVICREEIKHGIDLLETRLSKCSSRSNNVEEYLKTRAEI